MDAGAADRLSSWCVGTRGLLSVAAAARRRLDASVIYATMHERRHRPTPRNLSALGPRRVLDEGKAVTCTWLARELGVHVGVARE